MRDDGERASERVGEWMDWEGNGDRGGIRRDVPGRMLVQVQVEER